MCELFFPPARGAPVLPTPMAANFWASSHWCARVFGDPAPPCTSANELLKQTCSSLHSPAGVRLASARAARAQLRLTRSPSRSQVWLKEQREENLTEEDRQRVAERNRKNAEVFGADTMDEDLKRLRAHLAAFVTQLGKCKQVSVRQRVISTAIVYLARFYYYNSYKDFHPYLIAATALYLASKVEESPTTPKNIANALSDQRNSLGQVVAALPTSSIASSSGRVPPATRFGFSGGEIVEAEYFLVEELKFNLIVFHPYRPMQRMIVDANLQMYLQDATHLINDSYRTDVCLYYPPHTIAIAAIIMAAIWNGQSSWQQWFDSLQFHEVHKAQIKEVQGMLLQFYDQYTCLDPAEMERIIDKVPNHEPVGKTSASSTTLPRSTS